jgi:hypothetical protein
MPRKRFSAERIVTVLRQIDGVTAPGKPTVIRLICIRSSAGRPADSPPELGGAGPL